MIFAVYFLLLTVIGQIQMYRNIKEEKDLVYAYQIQQKIRLFQFHYECVLYAKLIRGD